MRNEEMDTFGQIISAAYDLYGKTFSEFALSLWWGALKNYDLKAISEALSRHINNPDNGQYLPKPADVVKMIGGTTTDSALIAWSKVDKAVREVGVYQDVVFDDPIIHCVLDEMGGWIALGGKTEKDWPFVAKEFETRYRGYASRQMTPEYQSVMTGLANAKNRQSGFPCFPPVLIGDATKAKKVMQLGGDKRQQITRLMDIVPALEGIA